MLVTTLTAATFLAACGMSAYAAAINGNVTFQCIFINSLDSTMSTVHCFVLFTGLNSTKEKHMKHIECQSIF